MIVGLRKLRETFFADTKCFWTKSETFFVSATNVARACMQTGKHLRRQQYVFVCQGLYACITYKRQLPNYCITDQLTQKQLWDDIIWRPSGKCSFVFLSIIRRLINGQFCITLQISNYVRKYHCFNRPFETNDHMLQNPPCWRQAHYYFLTGTLKLAAYHY